jgi:hypothetical protein
MPVQPIPNRCIWCLRSGANIQFNISHIVPNCVGNVNEHILPPGIVCTQCNSYFGSKVEPKLLADPPFHIIAVALGLVDPDDMQRFRERIFDADHPSDGRVLNDIKLKIDIHGASGQIQTDVEYTVKGCMTRVYTLEDRRWLSRAVHKIAFESLAWVLYVQDHADPVDLFSTSFNHVRMWVREGQPLKTVRPVVRRLPSNIQRNWSYYVWNTPNDGIAVELDLFGDWYLVSLKSKHNDVLSDLRSLTGQSHENATNAWVIADSFEKYVV